jgi:hypothetical protein
MNAHFVNIKVDREERPDVDAVYMAAVQAMTGGGGWPMTLMLTPERQPFFAGTYFPARAGDRGNSVGFLDILKQASQAWQTDPAALIAQGAHLSQFLGKRAQSQPADGVPEAELADRVAGALVVSHDPVHGGFGGPPRFPSADTLQFLMRHDALATGHAGQDAALKTLDAIRRGGIHDHVGGGFHRYATDTDWRVPHFEKMLYTQAQLSVALLDGWQISGDPALADATRDTLDYVMRELKTPEGGFISATDADSLRPDGASEEGWFFTWTPDEIRAVAGANATVAIDWYGVTEDGNLDGRNVLHLPLSIDALAARQSMGPDEAQQAVTAARRALYHHRSDRPPPAADDKIILAWNGLAISALAKASFLLDQPAYGMAARNAARHALRKMTDGDNRLLRSVRNGHGAQHAQLDDHALLALGLIDLFEATGEGDWLSGAERVVETMDDQFLAEDGAWWRTPADGEVLLTRDKPIRDGAVPSGNSAAITAHLRLYQLNRDPLHLQRAEQAFKALGGTLEGSGAGSPLTLHALDFYHAKPKQIVLIPGEGLAEMRKVLQTTFAPFKVQIPVPAGQVVLTGQAVRLVGEKDAIDGKATAYVCRAGVCKQPTTNPDLFRTQLLARTGE